MNSYLLRRLTPFFVFAILVELGFMLFQMFQNTANVDFSFFAIIKTFGVLLLTTTVSFMFIIVPYVIYLLLLPRHMQNGLFDRCITTVSFLFFSFSTLCEEAASQIFFEEFSSSFNFIALDYVVFTQKIISNLEQTYPVIQLLLGILLAAIITTAIAYRWLFTSVETPKFNRRLFHTVIYGFVCTLAYLNVNVAQIEISPNSYNNEIAKEGTFSLLSSLHKNDIDYSKFYITGNPDQNLSLLQKTLSGKNVTFIEPGKSIARQINSPRPEKRANIIVVLMKDMNSKYLSSEYKDLVPNLHRLTKESLYFKNTYAAGNRPARTIEALLLSLPPLPGFSVLSSPDNNNLYSLGSIFKTKGYENKWIYGGYGMADNIDHFFAKNAFQTLDRSHWHNGEISFTNLLAASDEDLYGKTLKEADKSFAKEKPFLSIIMTASNQSPYSVPDGKVEIAKTETSHHKAMKYADYALNKFVQDAKQKPWFDNTIFIFMADRASKNAGKPNAVISDYKIPLLIYAPKFVKNQTIETPLSQLDVMPTVLGLLDFNYESRFYGQDVLTPYYKPRIFFGDWQEIGYARNGIETKLIPGHNFIINPENTDKKTAKKYLDEAIAYYQQASRWHRNLKE